MDNNNDARPSFDDDVGVLGAPKTVHKPAVASGWLKAAQRTDAAPAAVLKAADLSAASTSSSSSSSSSTSSSSSSAAGITTPYAQLDSRWAKDPWDAFKQGVAVAMVLWEGLQIAITQEFVHDALEKSDILEENIVGLFEKHKTKLNVFELSDYLHDVMAQDFKTNLEDGSCDATAKMLCQLYLDCMEYKNFDGLEAMFAAAHNRPNTEHTFVGGEFDSDFDDDEDDDEDYYDEDEDEDDVDELEAVDKMLRDLDLNKTKESEPEEIKPKKQPTVTEPDEDGWATVVVQKNTGRRK